MTLMLVVLVGVLVAEDALLICATCIEEWGGIASRGTNGHSGKLSQTQLTVDSSHMCALWYCLVCMVYGCLEHAGEFAGQRVHCTAGKHTNLPDLPVLFDADNDMVAKASSCRP
jgi:hypothetical protein